MNLAEVFTTTDPVTVAEKVTNIVTNCFNGKFKVCAEGGTCYDVQDFPSALTLAFQLIFVFNVQYNSSVKCVYGAIEKLSCVRLKKKVNLGTNSKDLVNRLTS